MFGHHHEVASPTHQSPYPTAKVHGSMRGKGFPQTPLPQNVLLARKLPYTILQARPQSQLKEESLLLGGRGMGHENRKLWIQDLEAGYFRLRPKISQPGDADYDGIGLEPSDLGREDDDGDGEIEGSRVKTSRVPGGGDKEKER